MSETLKKNPDVSMETLFETLAIEDICLAADALRPVYEKSNGLDGLVTLAVSPQFANNTARLVSEAKRLWKILSRPNILIQIPATPEGIPAIEALISEDINVNATLIFSLAHYEAVAQAYLKGLSHCGAPQKVASVASLSISRVDTAVDRALETVGTPKALSIRGKVAIANARKIYRSFQKIFYGESFVKFKKEGARVQRPLFASAPAKNPGYSNVTYIEGLIGPDTINAVSPATLNGFRAHGKVKGTTIMTGRPETETILEKLQKVGVSLGEITEKLQFESVASLVSSSEKLQSALDLKCKLLLANQVSRKQSNLGQYQESVEKRLSTWKKKSFSSRLWKKDPTLWTLKRVREIRNRLGWLDLPEAMHEQLHDLFALSERVKAEGVRHVVLIGMGGASLAAEVFKQSFGCARGHPELIILDSTHPSAVQVVETQIELAHTLFLIASKSGTTTETLSLYRYFWQKLIERRRKPGPHFIAITDSRTPLDRLAQEREFRRIFLAPTDVGGRYSALSVFGLVPAALIGVNTREVLDRAWRMVESCAFCVEETKNPGLILGAALGELALAGRDKLTFLTPPTLTPLQAWIEQLIAESIGKSNKGILPVVNEVAWPEDAYGADRFFVSIDIGEAKNSDLHARVTSLLAAGHPVIEFNLPEMVDLGGEFFRWEIGVAAAGAILGIHPFNQPDVQLAKDFTRKAINQESKGGGKSSKATEPISISEDTLINSSVASWLAGAKEGNYFSLHAYLAPTQQITECLEAIRQALGSQTGLAVTSGYGPRLLHSTGQLHKGGPNNGLYLQILGEPNEDVAVPETNYTFGKLINAQALGDFKALTKRGRKILRVNLGKDVIGGLKHLAKVICN